MSEPRRIGLLFVHGIGQQEPWEHLRSAAARLAELLRDHPQSGASVSIVDRTGDWDDPLDPPRVIDQKNSKGLVPLAPMTIQYRMPSAGTAEGEAIDFECHEVWWADLGKRRGLGEAIRFWLWGMGQWNAPIYSQRDATKLTHSADDDRPSVHRPRSASQSPLIQIFSRLSLAWAGIVASLIVLSTWGIFRILSLVTGKKVSLDLIVDYLGDVEIYQKRATPGEGQMSDPGHPTRVAIRRRMVRQMVAMGARDYESWSIFAHSLGSVLAFNGIGEIAHTLPNYCEEELWDELPDELKRDPDCPLRKDTQFMIPARPAWLKQDDCINKGRLFGNLTNFITYGSPLGSFGAIWPRIVAFEKGVGTVEGKERKKGVFHNTRWINIVSGGDPVSGLVERYRPPKVPAEHKNDLPEEYNLIRPSWAVYGASHTAYFKPKWPSALGKGSEPSEYAEFHDEVVGQIMRKPGPPPHLASEQATVASHDRKRMLNSFLATIIVYTVCFSGLGILISLLGGTLPDGFQFYPDAAPYDLAEKIDWGAVWQTVPGWGMFWLSLAMGGVYTAGIYRYWIEAWRELADTKYELSVAPEEARERAADLRVGVKIDRGSFWANALFGIPTVFAWMALYASTVDWLVERVWGLHHVEQWVVLCAEHLPRIGIETSRPLVLVVVLALLLLINSIMQASLSLWAVSLRNKHKQLHG